MKPKRKPAAKKKAAAKPAGDAGTFKKLAPPRVPPPNKKPVDPRNIAEAMQAMIAAGRARVIAATLPDLMAVSASLGDVTAQALQAFVLERVKNPEQMSREDAEFIFDVHRGTVEGVTKAYETMVLNPMIPAGATDEEGHALPGQVIPPGASAPQVRRTKLFAALEAVNTAIDITPKN